MKILTNKNIILSTAVLLSALTCCLCTAVLSRTPMPILTATPTVALAPLPTTEVDTPTPTNTPTPTVEPAPVPIEPAAIATPMSSQACCKVCRKGRACGDSCINVGKECTEPPGCACNAN